jgi:hypothetical protein
VTAPCLRSQPWIPVLPSQPGFWDSSSLSQHLDLLAFETFLPFCAWCLLQGPMVQQVGLGPGQLEAMTILLFLGLFWLGMGEYI